MDYFVSIDGGREGPYSTLQLRQRLREGQIAPDTKVWRRGMAEWKPLREVDDLELFATEMEADHAAGRSVRTRETADTVEPDEDEPSDPGVPVKPLTGRRDSGEQEKNRQLSPRDLGSGVSPGRSNARPEKPKPPALPEDINAGLPREARAVLRFLARLVDFAIVSMAIGTWVALTVDEPMKWLQEAENARTVTFVLPICAIAYELILVALLGSTVGKMFFGIRLMDAGGGLLAPSQAAKRALGVWAVGMGFGISFLLLILPLFWWFRFRSTGVVAWDTWSGLAVVHRPPSRVRLTIGLIVVMLIFWQLIVAMAMLIGGGGGG